ncbi:MAG: tellurite resistance TerB family protein [Okeania sp. SIO2H7]|nr:tellurite resistance TerB family protein [Okeania sp. SIO2H7]
MSLFEQGTGQLQASDIKLEPAEGFAAIALIAVAADDIITTSESRAITTLFSRMELFSKYSEDDLREMTDKLLGIIKNKDIKPLFDAAVAVVPQELKETLFAVTTDLVLADGDLAEEEEQLLNELYGALKISGEMADKVIEVISIKNKG